MGLGISLLVMQEVDVFETAFTHNLGSMASAAGIYYCLWRAPEHDCLTAKDWIEPLTQGLALLQSKPDYFKAFNPPNGYGSYDGFVKGIEHLLNECKANPEAKLYTHR